MKNIYTAFFLFLMLAGLPPFLEAHEQRAVAEKYKVVVGFVNEPAFSSEMNGVDFRVTKDGNPVEGLDETFKAEVSQKKNKKYLTLAFRKRYKQPGVYAAYFLPVKPGGYIFHITGTLEGQPFDQVFESGNGFHDVEDSKPLRFPAE